MPIMNISANLRKIRRRQKFVPQILHFELESTSLKFSILCSKNSLLNCVTYIAHVEI